MPLSQWISMFVVICGCICFSVFLETRQRSFQGPLLMLEIGNLRTKLLVWHCLLCCVFDAYLTIDIFSRGGAELNPLMDIILQRDEAHFLASKYLLTAGCVGLLAIHSQRHLFRLRVQHILYSVASVYAVLVSYEIVGYVYLVILRRPIPDAVWRVHDYVLSIFS